MIITKKGFLKVNDIYRYCPFEHDTGNCGTWCALFGEPDIDHPDDRAHIMICRADWLCSIKDFTDERKKDES